MAQPPPPAVAALLRRAYTAFNNKDVDAVLATLREDVDWPNLLDGTRARGRASVRAYWVRQFASTDPQVEPLGMTTDAQGRVVVDVHQVVRAADGAVLDDRMVRHAYTLHEGLVARMDVLPG